MTRSIHAMAAHAIVRQSATCLALVLSSPALGQLFAGGAPRDDGPGVTLNAKILQGTYNQTLTTVPPNSSGGNAAVWQSGRLQFESYHYSPTWFRTTYFPIYAGVNPVKLSNLSVVSTGTIYQFHPKASGYSSRLDFLISCHRYVDTNGNHRFDYSESTVGSSLFLSQSSIQNHGEAVFAYDALSAIAGTYMFQPSSDYVFRLESRGQHGGDAGSEWDIRYELPTDGNRLSFTYATVPEPATTATLAIGLIFGLRRRKDLRKLCRAESNALAQSVSGESRS